MGFKQSPFPMVSGTSGHASALKKASAAKKTDWEAMQKKSAKADPRYGKMTAEEYKTEALRQAKHKKEYGTWDAMGTETKKRKADEQAKADERAANKALVDATNIAVEEKAKKDADYKKTFSTRKERLAARKKLREERRKIRKKARSGEISKEEKKKQIEASKAESKKYRRAGESKLVKGIRKIFTKKKKEE